MRRNDTPIASRLFMAFIASMITVNAVAAPDDNPPQPRLVVGIVVDDLQEDYLNLLRKNFSHGGFNRLLDRGVLLQNVDYGTSLDPVAATAILYTGASPAVNGIPAAEVFDTETLRPKSVLADKDYIGNYTSENFSPRALLSSTIADELRIAGDGNTYAYAFATDAPQAIIMAGHAGNSGVWINNANDCWSSTTYYRDMPKTAVDHNRNTPLASRLDTLVWTPAFPPSRYSHLPSSVTQTPFAYTFTDKGNKRILSFKNSPLANTVVTDMAISQIENMALGSHNGADMINLAYSLQPYQYSKNSDNRYELVDSYFRLDQDLQRLLDVIDRKVGLPNALIFVASTPPSSRTRRDDKKWQIPYGEFSTKKAVSLLNLFLISKYGNGNWVQAYHNGEFFLNRQLIKERDLDLQTMRRQAAEFLIQMQGVASAYSLDDIVTRRAGIDAHKLQQNTFIAHAGDVRISVLPGWELYDDYNNVQQRSGKVWREVAPTAPMLIMAPGLPQQTVAETVDARAIAPTVCSLLRIRSPNGASLPPLKLR